MSTNVMTTPSIRLSTVRYGRTRTSNHRPPAAGTWRELINTDDGVYWGSGVVNGPRASEPVPWQGEVQSLTLTLPPLATVMLVRED